ncbi:MAG: GTPase HflX [Elusimicrobiota bacterium]
MERAILLGLQLPKTKRNEVEDSIAELSRLAETAGAKPELTVIQKRHKTDPAYLIGAGKALELKELAREKNIKTIIFDEELKPVQQKNLEEAVEAKIIDRSRLILDIFAKRARSKEGILQVERAQLEYFLPRITERFGRFEQQTGGIGTRGPGEKKLEVDQRRVRERIALLDREIESVRFHRGVLRQKRLDSGQPVVTIAGYTNAGKSTLLNALSGATPGTDKNRGVYPVKNQDIAGFIPGKNRQSNSHKAYYAAREISNGVYADDKLFATLDPTTRQVKLPNGRIALFTDTVGFIKKLPHSLVAAFHATLEEISLSSCLVHVIDASHADYENQVRTVLSVLKELGAEKIPVINVYNKADLLLKEQRARLSRDGALLISARFGNGVEQLLSRIENIVVPKVYRHSIRVPYSKTRLLGQIHKLAVVKKREYTEKNVKLNIETTKEHWNKIRQILKTKY